MKHVDLYYQAIILWDMDGGYCCRHDELGIVRPSSGFPRVELAYPIVDLVRRQHNGPRSHVERSGRETSQKVSSFESPTATGNRRSSNLTIADHRCSVPPPLSESRFERLATSDRRPDPRLIPSVSGRVSLGPQSGQGRTPVPPVPSPPLALTPPP